MAAPSNKNLQQKILRMVRQQSFFTLVLMLLSLFLWGPRPGAFLGIAAGWGDILLLQWGIWQGMKKPPQKAAALMHQLMFVRILFLLGITVTALRGHWQPVLVFAGFLAYHGFFFVQLLHKRLDGQK